ncbi:MAG: hypothetical protein R3D67_15150 [Hyphomicrobiaceae bacterium]
MISDAVFGAGNHKVVSVSLVSAPSGFTAVHNASFNGSTDQRLLTLGGSLLPTEEVIVDFVVDIKVATTGQFANTVVATGASPLDGSPIPQATATADINLDAPGDLKKLIVEKSTSRPTARIGDVIPYKITVKNVDNLDRIDVDIVDFIPPGFTYRPQSASIDGVSVEPVLSGRRLVWTNRTIPASSTVTVRFTLGVGAAAAGNEFVNLGWAEDPLTRGRISNVGKAVVKREVEHVFDCGEIVGKVFDDKNRNGYQDDGEPGLPGVRVVTARGRLITTDKYGRYNVPCADIPDQRIGSNFVVKLDTRTLPTGYRVTTENPRVVRLTRGKLTKLNFGASISSVIRIDLNAKAFVGSSDKPSGTLVQGIDQLVRKLAGRPPSVLRLSYHAGRDREQARKRLQVVSRLVSDRWREVGGRYRLDIETTIVAGQ